MADIAGPASLRRGARLLLLDRTAHEQSQFCDSMPPLGYTPVLRLVNKTGVFLSVVVFVALTGCSQTERARGPGPLPSLTDPAPSASSSPVPGDTDSRATTGPGLDEVKEGLGYALIPEYLPVNMQVSRVSMSRGSARIFYGDSENTLIVAYPVPFSPEDTPFMREIGLIRPDDALSEVEVSGKTAYLMQGGWSEETVNQGPGIDPEQAEWNYTRSLTLFFEASLTDETSVAVAIQALSGPSQWIEIPEIVKIAESLRRSD